MPKDPQRASQLMVKACVGGFGQACFTACLAKMSAIQTCSNLGNTGPEPWRSVRAFVAARDTEERKRMLSASRELKFLRWITSEDAYLEIASLADWPSLRHAAQARLVEIARNDPDPDKRASVIPDIYTAIPIDVLKEIAVRDPDPNVRKVAKERLARDLPPQSIQGGGELERMAKSPDVESRRAAVGRLTDPARLAEMAEKDPDPQVREDAVDRLADYADASQAVLARIAEKDKDDRVRSSAAALVTDQKALERLLRTSRVTSVRRHALENLEGKPVDPSLLVWVAENDRDDDMRLEAAGRVTDQAVLARLARSSPNEQVRTVATRKLQDQKLLGEIAVKDPSDWVFKAAIGAITDGAILADVIRRRPEDYAVQLVARRTTDQRLLAEIATTAKEWLTRAIATGRLTDTQLLEKIATTNELPMMREAAKKRLAELRASPAR
jgi:hypothetical protein